ncbi:MAG: peptidoglycan editing factor PgeF [Thermomicrobiales bacterium]
MNQQFADPGLQVLRSDLLSAIPGVVHGFTGRVEGLGIADGNVGYSPPRDQPDAWRNRQAWASAIGVDPERIITPGQVHGDIVLRARERDAGIGARPGSGKLGLGDALMTSDSGPVLFSLHADCLPLLLVDPGVGTRTRAVAAVHAGWRGTVVDVVGATVRAMHEAFGSRPESMLAFIGPAIGPCCYEVGDDVTSAWRDRAGDEASHAIAPGPDRPHFDLQSANTLLLRRAGLREDHIEVAGLCTRCQADRWFSHRGQGAHTGRFAAVIALSV